MLTPLTGFPSAGKRIQIKAEEQKENKVKPGKVPGFALFSMEKKQVTKYGLLGKNISYSLSPLLHNAAFEKFGLEAGYVIFDKQERELETFFREEVLGGKVKGFNVTVPYKIKTKEFLQGRNADLHNWVQVIGALNTVKCVDGKLYGYNTDAEGFYRSVQQEFGIRIGPREEYRMFIAGAGGAGRAIALFTASMGIKKLDVFDVDPGRLDSLKEAFGQYPPHIRDKFNPLYSQDEAAAAAASADIIVNATPLGTHEEDPMPLPGGVLTDKHMVYDLVYARKTELLKHAEEAGAGTASGIGMLVNQAARSFEIWTGKPFDDVCQIMREAAEKAVREAARTERR
ncbi:MAG: hypothetical protein GF408_05170 [Candidatus Omnitrophica bacterium]|nr:hypothetical protein [Candidatus Omnitrophota bacterium]